MPVYTFVNNETDEEWEEIKTYEDMKSYLEENPHISLTFRNMAIGDSVRLGVTRAPSWFNDVKKGIKKANRGSKLDSGNVSEV